MATRYERTLQESELATEKSKARLDITSEELERLLLQKEGESLKDNALQGRSAGGAGGKRAIGKAVAKGGLLLKGKNPGNVRRSLSVSLFRSLVSGGGTDVHTHTHTHTLIRPAMTDPKTRRRHQIPNVLRNGYV